MVIKFHILKMIKGLRITIELSSSEGLFGDDVVELLF